MTTIDDIRMAQTRIAPHLVRTPVVRSAALGMALKLECRQVTGSFKARGALNKILLLGDAAREKGVVAASAGNHALGVANAAGIAGITRATLFVQANASPAKIERLKRYPIDLHLVGDTFEEAQAAALAFEKESGAIFVSAYDDGDVMAGQGTVGLEIGEDAPDITTVVVPTGGGALLGGVATALKAMHRGIRVIGVNPEASPSALQSLQGDEALDPFEHGETRAHGLAGGFGKTGFEAAKKFVDAIVLVSEKELAHATAALIDAEGVLAEPSGIAAVAAILAGKVKTKSPLAVVSGGNIDAASLREILSDA